MSIRAGCIVFLAALLVALAVPPGRVAAQTTLENRLKAAIVSKLPQFVEWPPAALSNRRQADVCVAAPDPFGRDLQDLLAGQRLGGRPEVVRVVDRDQDVDGCQLLYIPAPSLAAHRAMLQRTATLPVLTVGDSPGFLDLGGIVQLREIDGRMRFDIDATAATRVGLRISSQLLQLAGSVRGGQR